MSEGKRQIELVLAQGLQAEADLLTAFRDTASHVTGPTMMLDGPSWGLAVFQGAASATDYFDGKKAKQAAAIAGFDVNPDGKDNDRRADKKLTYSGLAGLMINDVREGHIASGVFVGGVILINAVRDTNIRSVRSKAEQESSININRAKAAGLMGGLVVGMSPLGETELGRRARNVGLAASTLLGIIGYFGTKRSLRGST